MNKSALKVSSGSAIGRTPRFGAPVSGLRATPALLIALLLSGTSTVIAAAEIKVYEWRDARGAVSYSQSPPPVGTQATSSRQIDTRDFTPAQTAAVKSYLSGLDAAELADAARFRRQTDAADETVRRAVNRLAAAERAFRQGRAPLAGERVGNAGGGSRLRSEYFERQKRLELAVEQARAALSDAYGARAAIKP